MQYTWDPKKAASNLKKHGVSFEEAKTVMTDPHVDMFPDSASGEGRTVLIGWSSKARILYVVTVEIDDDTMRIISARKATPAEIRSYDEA